MRDERMYKLYEVNRGTVLKGVNQKQECRCSEGKGIFKSPMNVLSRDHICEAIVYEIAKHYGVRCCYSKVIKVNNSIGSFSKYEDTKNNTIIPLEEIVNSSSLTVDKYVKVMNKLLYKRDFTECIRMLAIDFIVGQRDRHMENVAVYKLTDSWHKNSDKYKIYDMFDNGFCLASPTIPEHAIGELKQYNYSSRMGSGKDILEELIKHKKELSNFKNKLIMPKDVVDIITKCDRYCQIDDLLKLHMAKAICKRQRELVNRL